jgi:hypothetical protein
MDFTETSIQPGSLPIGIVSILNGQRGKASLLNIATGFPKKGQFLPEYTERPSIGDKTVECQSQDMHSRFKGQEGHPE